MAFAVGTNSYISVDDADIYFSDRLYTDDWDNLPDTSSKEIALITAFNLQEVSFDWLYDKTDPLQVQEFPRNDELTVPQKIIDTQCEITLLLVRNKADLYIPDKEMKHDVVSIKTDKVSIFSSIVLNLTRDYGQEKSLQSQKRVHTINVLR